MNENVAYLVRTWSMDSFACLWDIHKHAKESRQAIPFAPLIIFVIIQTLGNFTEPTKSLFQFFLYNFLLCFFFFFCLKILILAFSSEGERWWLLWYSSMRFILYIEKVDEIGSLRFWWISFQLNGRENIWGFLWFKFLKCF